MNQKKIIKEYDGIGRIDSCNLHDVEITFCQYSDGEIRGEVKNINDRHVAEFWNSLKDSPPLSQSKETYLLGIHLFSILFMLIILKPNCLAKILK